MNTREVVHVLNMACFSRALFIRPSAGCRRGLPPSTPPPPPPPPSFSWGSVFLSLSLSLPFSMNGKGHICHSPLPFTGRKEEGKGRRRGGEKEEEEGSDAYCKASPTSIQHVRLCGLQRIRKHPQNLQESKRIRKHL